MGDAMKWRRPLLLAGMLSILMVAAAAGEERIFIVKDYRYLPGKTGDATNGQSLCGTRCNALSTDYLNYTEPGGWRLIKVADDREVLLDLNNPFMDGQCVCVADEYEVRLDELNRPPQSKN